MTSTIEAAQPRQVGPGHGWVTYTTSSEIIVLNMAQRTLWADLVPVPNGTGL